MRSGILVLPVIVVEASMGVTAGAVIHWTGRYLELIWIGTIFCAIGTGLYIDLTATSSLGEIVGFQIVTGIGGGLLFEPPLIALQNTASQEDTAAATATQGFIRNLATSIAVVIGGVVFQNSMSMRTPELRSTGLSDSLAEKLSGDNAAANIETIKSIKNPMQLLAVKQAYAWSMRNMWIFYTGIAGIGVIASAFISRQKLSVEHTETKTGLREEPSKEGSPGVDTSGSSETEQAPARMSA